MIDAGDKTYAQAILYQFRALKRDTMQIAKVMLMTEAKVDRRLSYAMDNSVSPSLAAKAE